MTASSHRCVEDETALRMKFVRGRQKVFRRNFRILKDAPCLRRKNVFRKKAPGKKNYVRGKRDHSGPGRTVWVVRTGRRGEEEVERVCSDRHET